MTTAVRFEVRGPPFPPASRRPSGRCRCWCRAASPTTTLVLSRGRLQVGFSAGAPANSELLAGLVYDGDWRGYDFSHARIARLAQNLRGEFLGGADTVVPYPAGPQRPRLRPHDPGLAQRLWYGAGSLRSVVWAAGHGLHLVVGNICAGEGLGTDDFGTAQLTQIRTYRQNFAGPGRPRVVVGRVIVPLDSADAAAFAHEEYEQILSDVAASIAPQLGWSPSESG